MSHKTSLKTLCFAPSEDGFKWNIQYSYHDGTDKKVELIDYSANDDVPELDSLAKIEFKKLFRQAYQVFGYPRLSKVITLASFYEGHDNPSFTFYLSEAAERDPLPFSSQPSFTSYGFPQLTIMPKAIYKDKLKIADSGVTLKIVDFDKNLYLIEILEKKIRGALSREVRVRTLIDEKPVTPFCQRMAANASYEDCLKPALQFLSRRGFRPKGDALTTKDITSLIDIGQQAMIDIIGQQQGR